MRVDQSGMGLVPNGVHGSMGSPSASKLTRSEPRVQAAGVLGMALPLHRKPRPSPVTRGSSGDVRMVVFTVSVVISPLMSCSVCSAE